MNHLSIVQNEQARILIVGLDGKVKQELTQPKGGEFDYDEANHYYSNRLVIITKYCGTAVCILILILTSDAVSNKSFAVSLTERLVT